MESQIDLLLHLKSWGYIKSIRAVSAMEHVDRKHFIPCHENPYEDTAHYFACGINMSAPHTHALALEQLKDHLHKGDHALDVGFGSGYMTASMAVLVGEHGCVTGIDNIPQLLPLATECISKSMPHAIQSGQIKLVIGDGRNGFEDHAPYSAIHVGAAVTEVPQALLEQLKPGGRMFIPVDGQYQVVDKSDTGSISYTYLMPCKDKLETLSDPKPFSDKPHPLIHKHTITLPHAQMITERSRPSITLPPSPTITEKSRHPSFRSTAIEQATKNANVSTIKGYTFDKTQILGKGKYGVVYKGHRTSDKSPVAVKHIKSMPENKEWQILEIVRNPYILCLLDHSFVEHELYVVTEVCDCDLRKFLHDCGGTFSLSNMQVVAHQLSKGYMALFSADIIHRDIKPANILVEKLQDGARLKLADFGCGKILDKLQYAETIVGASGYLAPEVIFRHYDAKADVFSMGLVLYECFFGDHLEQTISDIEQGLTIDSSDLDLNDLLTKMLQYDSKHRMSPTDFFGHMFHASVPNGALIKVTVGYDKHL